MHAHAFGDDEYSNSVAVWRAVRIHIQHNDSQTRLTAVSLPEVLFLMLSHLLISTVVVSPNPGSHYVP